VYDIEFQRNGRQDIAMRVAIERAAKRKRQREIAEHAGMREFHERDAAWERKLEIQRLTRTLDALYARQRGGERSERLTAQVAWLEALFGALEGHPSAMVDAVRLI
jgi:hypothetical protein